MHGVGAQVLRERSFSPPHSFLKNSRKMKQQITYNETDGRRRPYLVSCDWLSISCQLTRNSDFTHEHLQSGYYVKEKGHGTKQWQHVADVLEADETPIGTIAWLPRRSSISQLAAVFKVENSVLYEQNFWDRVCAALLALGLRFVGISRMDIACDFNEFFNGLQAQTLIDGYISGKYVKVGLAKAYAFIDAGYHASHSDKGLAIHDRVPNFPGTDQLKRDEKWVSERNADIADSGLPLLQLQQARPIRAPRPAQVQSLTFGKAGNPVQVILYNKTKELQEVAMKRYIVENWRAARLDLSKPIWRVEIRLRSEACKLQNLCNGEIQALSLVDIVSQQQIEAIFTAYAEKYFKWFLFDGHEKIQNSPRQQLFSFTQEPVYRPKRRKVKKDASRYLRGLVGQLDKATFANTRSGNNLMALHCKRVADFFRNCFEGLDAVKMQQAKKDFLSGHIAVPMNETKHTDILYDGYSTERAIQIGADITEARRRLAGSLSLDDMYRRSQRSEINWDNIADDTWVDEDVCRSINESIINTIFSPSSNLDYD